MVLEPGQPEQLLSAEDTLAWLERHLRALDELPEDLRGLGNLPAAAQRLLETACELELQLGLSLQWFAVRLEAPGQS